MQRSGRQLQQLPRHRDGVSRARWSLEAVIGVADLGKAQGETFVSDQTAQWLGQRFRQLAPQVRNLGGRIFAGRPQWIQPIAEPGEVDEPSFALNAFFPINRSFKARNEQIGYTLKLTVWDDGTHRRVVIGTQAGRQMDRPQAAGAKRRLITMLGAADPSLRPETQA